MISLSFSVRAILMTVMIAALGIHLESHGLAAETWTDVTGKFRIEAEYVGVKGHSVVLRRLDNTTISVPINRLSVESRAQAKRLYERAKPRTSTATSPAPVPSPMLGDSRSSLGPNAASEDADGKAPSNETPPPAAATTETPSSFGHSDPGPAVVSSSLRLKPNFTPPKPPAVEPLVSFPENASLQDTVDFVRTQLLAGHPEVVWYALPDEIRQKLDSQQVRDLVGAMTQNQKAVSEALETAMMKTIEILITKKRFVLKSPLMSQVPPPLVPMAEQAYDPITGIAYELTDWLYSVESLSQQTITSWVDFHGPRVGGHLRELTKMLPPPLIDQFVNQVTVEQTSNSAGTITYPNSEGGTDEIEMVLYGGRWLPKPFAQRWQAKKDSMVAELSEQLNVAKQQHPNAAEQDASLAGIISGIADRALDPLRDASTQAEFDQAVIGLAAVMQTFDRSGASDEAKVASTRVQMNALKNFILMFQIRMNSLPRTLAELRDGPEDPAKKAYWVGPILTEFPTDSWANPFDYSLQGNSYTIRSRGADGVADTEDDLTVQGP